MTGIVPPVTGLLLVDSLLAGETDIFFNAVWHLLLPASVLGFFSLAYIARMTRSFMLDQLAQEYVDDGAGQGRAGAAGDLAARLPADPACR